MKKFNTFFASLAALILLTFSACEEQMVVIPEISNPDTGRVVLIEEITGVRCPNCPAGAATIEGFKQLFPGKVISIAYHSPPFLVAPLSSSQYDFRRDEAQDIDQLIGESIGKPSAAINRVQFADEQRTWVDFIDKWQGYLQEELNKIPALFLDIDNVYNSETREVQIRVTGTPQGTFNSEFFLTVAVLENNMIDPQLDQNQEIEDYEHNHVFHALVNDNIGGDLFASSLTIDEEVSKTFTFTLPTNEEDPKVPWVAENCEIVAFVTNAAGTVEQAAKAKVIE